MNEIIEELLKKASEHVGSISLSYNREQLVFRAAIRSEADPLKRRMTMFSDTLAGVLCKIITCEEHFLAMSEGERRDVVLESERLDRQVGLLMASKCGPSCGYCGRCS